MIIIVYGLARWLSGRALGSQSQKLGLKPDPNWQEKEEFRPTASP